MTIEDFPLLLAGCCVFFALLYLVLWIALRIYIAWEVRKRNKPITPAQWNKLIKKIKDMRTDWPEY